MPNPTHMVPAYGRDYKTSEEALASWKEGKDFLISDIGSHWDGRYTSIRDWAKDETVLIRYNRRTEFIITCGRKHPNFAYRGG